MHSPCTQITFIPSSYPNAPSTLLNIKHSTNQVFGEKLFHPSFFFACRHNHFPAYLFLPTG